MLPSMQTYFPATSGLNYCKWGCICKVFTFAIICKQKTLPIQEININLISINLKDLQFAKARVNVASL